MCSGEEEKYKEKSKVVIERSKEYTCVEEKKRRKKNINKRVDERKRDKEKNKIKKCYYNIFIINLKWWVITS